MAIYRGATKLAGVGKGFSPENTGNTGDKLEKTPSGYQWVDGELVGINNVPDDYSAMQGPAPSGFHVPLQAEWEGLKTIMTGLGLGGSWKSNLHIPFVGRRIPNGSIATQGTYGYYWSCSPAGSNYPVYEAKAVVLYSSDVNADSHEPRVYGYSVRCFKDLFEKPTSSWTVINGTLGGAGIFRNQADGLISITSDGTTGYTIQDKNLGATTVYNNGDALTQDNMGNTYQWGNNYGFPSTGSVTTSSTQVDASAYGPGNYYSSSTFITRGNTPYDWSSVQNDNLRGGVTGIITNGNEVAAGNILIYKTIKVVLFPSGWSSNEQTVTATGVTATNTVIVSPDPSSFEDYTGATIYCSAQSTNSLTFTCDSEPSTDITVNVMIFS